MNTLYFVVPGDPETLTGGYIYDRRIVAQLQRLGWEITLRQLDASFPYPCAGALAHADKTLSEIADGATAIIDGLAFSAMPDIVQKHAARLRLVALIHHPLALETPLAETQRRYFFACEKRALQAAQRIIVTSAATARALRDYGVAPERIAVVPPGVDSAPLARRSDDSGYALLCVASFTARKGHRVLIDALASLPDYPWRLRCIGSKSLAPEISCAIDQQVRTLGLQKRIALIDAVPQAALSAYYRNADLFVLASYHEGYGMVLGEALAHGLPIIATRAGAIPDTVGEGAALLARPGDSESLAQCIKAFFSDAVLRTRMRDSARQIRARLPGWERAGVLFGAQVRRLQRRHNGRL